MRDKVSRAQRSAPYARPAVSVGVAPNGTLSAGPVHVYGRDVIPSRSSSFGSTSSESSQESSDTPYPPVMPSSVSRPRANQSVRHSSSSVGPSAIPLSTPIGPPYTAAAAPLATPVAPLPAPSVVALKIADYIRRGLSANHLPPASRTQEWTKVPFWKSAPHTPHLNGCDTLGLLYHRMPEGAQVDFARAIQLLGWHVHPGFFMTLAERSLHFDQNGRPRRLP